VLHLLLVLAVGGGAFKFMTASINSTGWFTKLAKVTAAITVSFRLFKVVKPLGEYLGGVFIRSLNSFSCCEKPQAIIFRFKVVRVSPMQLKVLMLLPTQLKMVQQPLTLQQ
jgi:hypothetical protein